MAVARSSADDDNAGFVDDVMLAHNGPWLTGRILKVTHQGAEPGARYDVYDSLGLVTTLFLAFTLKCQQVTVLQSRNA